MRYVTFFTFFYVLLTFQFLPAQEPVYEWIRTANGTTWDEASAVACDNQGNSIATGYFEGSFIIADSSFNSGTYADIFLVKHDSDGNFVWAKQLASETGTYGYAVYLDNYGNSYLSGIFRDSLRINNISYPGYSTQTGFFAKLDQNGNIVWFKISGSENGWIWPTDLMSLSNGDIVCAGMYSGTVTIGDSTVTTSEAGVFLALYSTTGYFIKLIETCSGVINYLDMYGIASDNMDNMYIGGTFQGTLTFSDTSIYSIGWHDIFIAKFDDQGNFLWARQEGDVYSDIGLDVAADQYGNSAITGYFSGSITVGDTTLTARGNEDIFIIKYDPDGNVLWARSAGGNLSMALDEANGISADSEGNFYIAGHFEGSALFGDTTLISSGYTDIVCAKYDSDGHCLWAAKVGGTDEEWGEDIALNNQGDIFLAGWYASTITFGDTTITSMDRTDVCIFKLSESEISSVYENSNLPKQIKLQQNYPNPFNPTTTIEFDLPKTSEVTLKIFNILGEEVVTLVSDRLSTGSYSYDWDASNLASGVYLYRLQAGDYVETRKMVLMR